MSYRQEWIDSKRTVPELRAEIKTVAALLTGNLPSKGTSKMKKAELVEYLAEYRRRLYVARANGAAYEQEAAKRGMVYDKETGTWGEDDTWAIQSEPDAEEWGWVPPKSQEDQEARYQREADEWYGRFRDREQQVGEPKIFQGALHEATKGLIVASSEEDQEVVDHGRTVAEQLDREHATWLGRAVTVRSMGRTVHGKVFDVVPGADGTGRVCLVVQHEGKLTRTLHAPADVKLATTS